MLKKKHLQSAPIFNMKQSWKNRIIHYYAISKIFHCSPFRIKVYNSNWWNKAFYKQYGRNMNNAIYIWYETSPFSRGLISNSTPPLKLIFTWLFLILIKNTAKYEGLTNTEINAQTCFWNPYSIRIATIFHQSPSILRTLADNVKWN